MKRQGELIETLAKRARDLRMSKDPRPKKIEKLRAFLGDSKNGLASMPPLPLPLNAKIEVTGIIAEKSSVFKSNMFPMLLYFQVSDGSEFPVIFKGLEIRFGLDGWSGILSSYMQHRRT